ncbi:MAG: YfhO family protein [Spirosomataceae bacterium]
MLLLIGILFWDFLSQKYPYLFIDIGIDSTIIIYPNLVHLADYWQQYGMPSWSFNEGIGKNIYPFWFDPFTNFLLFFSPKGIAQGLIYVAVIEIILSGFCFYAFLKELKTSAFASIVGALSYAFCGYMILCGAWDINRYSTEVLYAALLLWLLERYIQRKEWIWLPLPFALMAIQAPFNVYLYALLSLLYIGLRLPAVKVSFSFFSPLVIAGFIGLGLSSFMLFSNVIQILDSPRGSGDVSYTASLMGTSVFQLASKEEFSSLFNRLFSPNLSGYVDQFKGWSNYMEAPVLYCGILSVMVFPQAFAVLNRKEKIALSITFGILVLVCVFPFLRRLVWLFTGDYYRSISLFVAIWMIYGYTQALSRLEQGQKLNLVVLIATTFCALIVLFFPYEIKATSSKNIRPVVAVLVLLYTVILLFYRSNTYRTWSQLVLLVLLVGEILFLQYPTINKRKLATYDLLFDFGANKGYNDGVKEAVALLKKRDKSPFYRIEKDFSSVGFDQGGYLNSSNDSKIQNYYGSRCYSSFNQVNYIRYLRKLHLINPNDELSTRFIFNGLALDPIAGAGLCNIKYFLSHKNRTTDLGPLGYEYVTRTPELWIYKYRFSLPLGVTYRSYLLSDELDKQEGKFEKQYALTRGVALDTEQHELMKQLEKIPEDTLLTVSLTSLERNINALKEDSLTIQAFEPTHVKGSISLKTNKLLFLSIPHDRGWKATVDGNETPIERVNMGFMGLMLSKGKHEIELHFEPPMVKIGCIVSLLFLLGYAGVIWKLKKPTTS